MSRADSVLIMNCNSIIIGDGSEQSDLSTGSLRGTEAVGSSTSISISESARNIAILIYGKS